MVATTESRLATHHVLIPGILHFFLEPNIHLWWGQMKVTKFESPHFKVHSKLIEMGMEIRSKESIWANRAGKHPEHLRASSATCALRAVLLWFYLNALLWKSLLYHLWQWYNTQLSLYLEQPGSSSLHVELFSGNPYALKWNLTY